MAILWVRRQIGSRMQIGENGVRSYQVVFLVKSDWCAENRRTILQHPDLPTYGKPFPDDGTATCSRIDPQQSTEDPYLWRVVCEWTTTHGGSQPDDDQLPPDERRQKWEYAFSRIRKFRPRDLDGLCFKDSAPHPSTPRRRSRSSSMSSRSAATSHSWTAARITSSWAPRT